MNRKFISMALIALCMPTFVAAQEDEDPFEYEVGSFKSNWFMGVGVGAQTYFGDHDKQLKFKDRITPAFQLRGGKWLTQSFGLQLNVGGFSFKGATHRGDQDYGYAHRVINDNLKADGKIDSKGIIQDSELKKPEEGSGLLHYQKWHYMQAHLDLMVNLHNLIAGYKYDRVWNIIPYAGIGFMGAFSDQTDETRNDPACYQEGNDGGVEVSGSAGILNTFRISDGWNLTFDVSAHIVGDRFDGDVNPQYSSNNSARANEGALAATVGIQYTFKPRGWTKTRNVRVVDDSFINNLRETMERLDRENQSLKESTAKTEVTNEVSYTTQISAPVLISFNKHSAKLTKKDRVNLGFMAEVIKASTAGEVYTISARADSSEEDRSKQLSQQRAKAILECLTQEYGVPEEKLILGEPDTSYTGSNNNKAIISKATK